MSSGSRRIPIQNNQQRQPPNARAANQWQSSLDLVFSFSRSQAFFGSNLPTSPSCVSASFPIPISHAIAPHLAELIRSFSPILILPNSHNVLYSFVARYKRPGLEDEESSVTASEDRGASASEDGLRETSDEDDGEGVAWSDGEGEFSVDGIPQGQHSWEGELPRNAVQPSGSRKSSKNRKKPKAQPSTSQSRSEHSTTTSSSLGSAGDDRHPPQISHHLQPPPSSLHRSILPSSERTPLLQRQSSSSLSKIKPLGNNGPVSFSPPDSVPFPRRTASVSAALKRNNPGASGLGDISDVSSRKMSIISSEAWTEALEATRGMSTYGQTLFNTVNVLIGVGLLAEPLAFADAGWVLGTLILLFCALITNYTAKMLAKMMSRDLTLQTYADVLIKAYGPRARTFIHVMFVMELGALSIALVVLFSDSMANLFPRFSSTDFKLLGFFIILPTTYLPLRFLSITSLVGILSSFTLFFVLLADGCIKKHQPGSLWRPMWTSVGPRWIRLPLSFGLLMSGFSGHAVIPSLYRDMKRPNRFNSMINTAYIIAFTISMLMGTLGYLMFGNSVSDEITRDMRKTKGYPAALNTLSIWMIAINPVVKYALACRPLVSTVEHLVGIKHTPPPPPEDPFDDGSAIMSDTASLSLPDEDLPSTPRAPLYLRILERSIRPVMTAFIVFLAIVIPDFGRVLSFLGSSSAFLICVIGPVGAYLILGRKSRPLDKGPRQSPEDWSLGSVETAFCWMLLVVSILMAVVGTVWTFIDVPEPGRGNHGHH